MASGSHTGQHSSEDSICWTHYTITICGIHLHINLPLWYYQVIMYYIVLCARPCLKHLPEYSLHPHINTMRLRPIIPLNVNTKTQKGRVTCPNSVSGRTQLNLAAAFSSRSKSRIKRSPHYCTVYDWCLWSFVILTQSLFLPYPCLCYFRNWFFCPVECLILDFDDYPCDVTYIPHNVPISCTQVIRPRILSDSGSF